MPRNGATLDENADSFFERRVQESPPLMKTADSPFEGVQGDVPPDRNAATPACNCGASHLLWRLSSGRQVKMFASQG